MIIKAFAKINLTLDITGIRPDGYHAISSVMTPISLCDTITLESAESLSFRCDIPSISGEDNLCVRSAKAFFKAANIQPSVSIKLEKQIPFPAGLGGGSADAAAVIKGLNEFYNNPLPSEKLFEIAESVGSDVPFCLYGNTALCEGRGEVLTPLKLNRGYHVVIAIGESRLSTAEVYRRFDSMQIPPVEKTPDFVNALKANDNEKALEYMSNAFESVTDVICPETKQMRDLLLASGALTSHLSGSGPSVYGLFDNEASAHSSAEFLTEKGFSAYECKILG